MCLMRTTSVFEAEWNSISPERALLHPQTDINEESYEVSEKPNGILRYGLRNIRQSIAYISLLLTAETAYILQQDIEQPTPIVQMNESSYLQFVRYKAEGLPSSDAPIEEIIDSLDTDEKYIEFLKKYSDGYFPVTPWTFLGSYAYSPTQLQEENWTAPCNGFAEFACEVGTRHGKKMYLLSLWPDGKTTTEHHDENTVEEHKHRNSWHLVAFYKLQDGQSGQSQYVIFDNNNLIRLEPGEPLSTYTSQQHYDIIHPLGGITEWKRPYDDWRAKIARHIGSINEDQVIETVIPHSSIMSIAKK